ncbi:hypothetical protein EU528_06205 [Candidatus Thorarchaeota archaeon]|nr:MAG: hypothetical protein EU528_06205 [Candidatus Thorarchaeota archaeon]
MPKWEAAVATENPKILFRIIQLLKELDIKFVICSPVDHRCEHANVVITGPNDNSKEHKGKIEVAEDFDTDFARIEIMSKLHGLQNPSKAVVGIDPGMTSGVALVIDGFPVYSNSPTSPRIVAILTQTLLAYVNTLFPSCQKLVRLGTGSKLYATLLLRAITKTDVNLSIELVNEQRTTIIGGARSDEPAAILIAGRPGRSPSLSDFSIEPKEGYIQSLKRYVTRLTRGKKSISSKEARALLSGESTIEDVIAHS